MIRPATSDDIPALVRLMQHVQDIHAEAHPQVFMRTLETEPAAAFFSKVLADNMNILLVAEQRGKPIGYVWCEERQPSETFYAHAEHTGYIHHISIKPNDRRRGVGRALVEKALVEMERRGVAHVGVDFWSFNERARAFFAEFGFIVQREVCGRKLR